uniref:Uncharacterized protein n=1 Tax=Oryza glaberrima TaxID=4538 RepID=I1NP11_ORYGL
MGKDLVFSIRLRGGSGRGDVPTCGEGEAPRLTLSLRKRRNTGNGEVHWQAGQGFHLGVSSKQSNRNGSHQMPPTHQRYLFYAHNHLYTVDDLLSHHARPVELVGATRTPLPSVRTGLTLESAEPLERRRIWAYAARSGCPRAALATGPRRGGRRCQVGRRQDTGCPRSGGKEGGREERDEEGERKREGSAGATGTAFAGGGNKSGTRPGSPAHSGSRLRVAQGERHGSHRRRKSPCDLKYSR